MEENSVFYVRGVFATFLCNKRRYHYSSLLFTGAGLAQSVERLTAEREVVGLIPGSGPTLRVLK